VIGSRQALRGSRSIRALAVQAEIAVAVERRGEGEVTDGENSAMSPPCFTVDLCEIGSREAGCADDDVCALVKSGDDVLLRDLGLCVFHEDVDGVEVERLERGRENGGGDAAITQCGAKRLPGRTSRDGRDQDHFIARRGYGACQLSEPAQPVAPARQTRVIVRSYPRGLVDRFFRPHDKLLTSGVGTGSRADL